MATITPIPKSEIPISPLAKVGSIGISIPKPSKSMNTVTNIIQNAQYCSNTNLEFVRDIKVGHSLTKLTN